MASTMTRQHFVAIANDIGLAMRRTEQDNDSDHDQIVGLQSLYEVRNLIADSLAGFNSGFDQARFFDHIERVREMGL